MASSFARSDVQRELAALLLLVPECTTPVARQRKRRQRRLALALSALAVEAGAPPVTLRSMKEAAI